MRTLCQRNFWSCFIHFLDTVSTDYFSHFLEIAKCYPQSLPHRSPIVNAPWSLPYCYHYCWMLVFPYKWGGPQSHQDMGFLPTEIPHGRHEHGGVGRNWRQDFSASSGRYMQKLWRHCRPFFYHIPSSWFFVHKFSPPLLQVFREGV